MNCPICSGTINDNAKFCGKCGNKVPRCPACGTLITKRIKFCTRDGTVIPQEMLDLLPEQDAEVTAAIGAEVAAVMTEISEPDKTVLQYPQPASSGTPHPPRNPKTPSRRFCVKCGGPCEEGQTICRRCRVAAMDSMNRPVRKKKKSALSIVLILLLVLLLLAGIGVGGYFLFSEVIFPNSQTLQEQDNDRDDPDEDADADEDRDAADEDEDEPEETEEPTEAPTEAPTEPPTEPEPVYEYFYEVVKSDMSWLEAKSACEAKGGYLATISSQEEFDRISQLAADSGLTYLWVGAYLQSDSSSWADSAWITGESWTFENWYPGEPSKTDSDGTRESYLCIWKAKYQGNDIGWTFNDQRNDIVAALPSISGKVGYICEYKVEVYQ